MVDIKKILAHFWSWMFSERVFLPRDINSGQKIQVIGSITDLLQNPRMGFPEFVVAPHLYNVKISVTKQKLRGGLSFFFLQGNLPSGNIQKILIGILPS